jgi:hypothetical protein
MLLCYYGLYPLLDDGLMTSTFDDYLCNGVDVIIISLVNVM